MTSATHRAIDAVWRIESARVIAGIARIVHDVGVAEELAQDALVAALEQWPESGVPRNPAAWLMAIGERRAIDLVRRKETFAGKLAEVGRELGAASDRHSDIAARALDDDIDDDLLRLVFISCHPVLSTEARVALTLRLLGGLTTEEIARAFLASEPTIAQRIVRAKRTLTQARVPFEVPEPAERADRLSSVLEVTYLVFNEGLLGDRRGRLDPSSAATPTTPTSSCPAWRDGCCRGSMMMAELAPWTLCGTPSRRIEPTGVWSTRRHAGS